MPPDERDSAVALEAPADATLATERRRVRLISLGTAVVWLLAAAILTVVVSNRVLTDYLSEASDAASRDSVELSGVVNRVFRELTAMALVLSNSGELRQLTARYNARGDAFERMTQAERSALLKQDADITSVNGRLTAVRHQLNYDLISILDARGIRILTSDWDQPVSLLGDAFEDRPYFKDSMNGRVGQIFILARDTHLPVMLFSAPVPGDAGPSGVVVVRQASNAIGAALAGGGHVTLVIDRFGMVVASSQEDLTLYHAGALADSRPDAETLRAIYAQDHLRTLDVKRPRNPLHADAWVFQGRRYLLKRQTLAVPGYSLIVLTPIERFEAVRPLHYAIGTLAALFGLLVILLVDRRVEAGVHRRHELRATAALNAKLKALNDEKDRYLGIAAHDLRNPLSSTRGLAELLLETKLEPDQREFLETIHRTSDEMLTLVNDLLDTSVIESGKLNLRRADCDVSKLLRQRIRLLEPYARSKQIVLAIDAIAGQRANIDASRFAQVVDNLISNAIKFSPLATTVDVSLRFSGTGFTFAVQDHGPGISDADKKLLFRTFQKLSARPTAGEHSTGLGLAIVKKIVDAHGGRIEVDDTPGGGTQFTVTMPF
jgi:signal transduction histidine kinase